MRKNVKLIAQNKTQQKYNTARIYFSCTKLKVKKPGRHPFSTYAPQGGGTS